MFPMLRSVIHNLFGRPATRNYPTERRDPVPNSRGGLVLDPETCIFCGLCAARCPARAISVARAPKEWTLDPYRCILCGYCVEVCPKKCLRMEPERGNYLESQ